MAYEQLPGAINAPALGGQYQTASPNDVYVTNDINSTLALVSALLTDFDSRYLGAHSSDPVLDTLGNPLIDGALYYNTSQDALMTYYSGAWHSWNLGGGSTGVGSFGYENNYNVNVNWTIATGKNAVSAGPMSVDSGVSVTVPSGSVWTIV